MQHARPRCAVGACLICVHVVFTDFSCDRECDLQTLYISKIPCSSAYVLNSGGIRSGLLVWSIFQRNGSFFKFLVLTALLCQWIPNPIELFFCSNTFTVLFLVILLNIIEWQIMYTQRNYLAFIGNWFTNVWANIICSSMCDNFECIRPSSSK